MFLSAKIEENVADLSVKEWKIFTNTPYTIPCIRLAAPRQSKQVSLRSVCTIFAKDVIKSNAENNPQLSTPNCHLWWHKYRLFRL